MRSGRFGAEARRVDGQPGAEIEPEAAIRVDVAVDEWSEASHVICVETVLPSGFGQDLLNHEGVDVDERKLDQMEAKHADLLVIGAVGGDFAAFTEENEVVGAVPALDDVQAFVDLTAQLHGVQIAAQEDRLDRFAEFAEGAVDRVLDVGAVEAPQDVFGVRGLEPESRGVLDHGIVLLGDQLPIDGPGEHGGEFWVEGAVVGTVKPLRVDGLEPWQQLKAEQPAKGKSHFALSVAVGVLALNSRVGAVTKDALDHGRHLGGGTAL